MKKHRQYSFEGIIVDILSEYDERSGIYFDDIPDFEENPIYTPTGKPLVSAIQDKCRYYESNNNDADCGSCAFYKPNNPGDLIGICTNPQNKQSMEDNEKEVV